MGFSFGLIVGLNIRIVTIATIGVIGFILAFEFFTGFLEFCVSESPLHREMVQTIYKELTMMGVVSFIVVMVNASKAAADHFDWIVSIDFSHILLFYLAIFFVFHAIYIMRLSYTASKYHTQYQSETVQGLVASIHESSKGFISTLLYYFDWLPLSLLREKVEFKLLSVIFIDKNWLPENIDFSMYLTLCYEKFALKTIERGLFSWSVLISLVIINFIRVRANLFANCGHTDIFHAPATHDDTSADDGHRRLAGGVYLDSVSDECYLTQTVLFLYCGFTVTIFTLILFGFCRYYIKSIIALSGASTVSEYINVLEFLYQREVESVLNKENPGDPTDASRFTFAELKEQVLSEIDSHKHGDHRTALYQYILQQGMRLIGGIIELLYDIMHWIYLKIFLILNGAKEQIGSSAKLADLLSLGRARGRTLSNDDADFAKTNHESKHTNSSDSHHNSSSSGSTKGEASSHHEHDAAHGNGFLAALQNKGRKRTILVNNNKPSDNQDVINATKFVGIKTFDNSELDNKSPESNEKPRNSFTDGRRKSAVDAEVNKLKQYSSVKTYKILDFSGKDVSKDSNIDPELVKSVLNQINNSTSNKPSLKGYSARMRSESSSNLIDTEKRAPRAGKRNNDIRNSRRTAVSQVSSVRLVSKLESYRLMQKEAKDRLDLIASWSQKKSREGKNDPDEKHSEDSDDEEDDIDTLSLEDGNGGRRQKKKKASRTLSCLDYLDMLLETSENYLTAAYGFVKRIFISCFSYLKRFCTKKELNNKVGPADGLEDWMLPDNFNGLFFFNNPKLLFMAFEVCVVLNCLYLANWAINFIYIVQKKTEWKWFWQTMMVCPLIFNLPIIGIMSRYCSYLSAFLEIDCESMYKTLLDMEERQEIILELRGRIISSLSHATMPKEQVLQVIFDIVDSDRSGFIDRFEFKRFLSELRLSYSEERYNKLYKAVDVNCDHFISFDEISDLIFPKLTKEEELQQNKLMKKSSFRKERKSILDVISLQKAVSKASELRKSLNEAKERSSLRNDSIDEEDDDEDEDDDEEEDEEDDEGNDDNNNSADDSSNLPFTNVLRNRQETILKINNSPRGSILNVNSGKNSIRAASETLVDAEDDV